MDGDEQKGFEEENTTKSVEQSRVDLAFFIFIAQAGIFADDLPPFVFPAF